MSKLRVLVTGVGGQLGHDVMNELKKRGHCGVGSDLLAAGDGGQPQGERMPYVQLDITDKNAVRKVISEQKPEVIIHCAAWTAVDAAENTENQHKVHAINVIGTKNIAEAAKKTGAKMVYISTDYVFDGTGGEPWSPEDTAFAPLNYYGETKLGGERAVAETLDRYFIVRIAWVFGTNGRNFVRTMLRVGRTHDKVSVVADQIGTPTYTFDLARLLVDMIETEKYGIYHATNEGGYISWYDFTRKIYETAARLGHPEYGQIEVVPVTTEEYGSLPAKRPKNSRLDKSKLVQCGFTPLPSWQDAVTRYIRELDFDFL